MNIYQKTFLTLIILAVLGFVVPVKYKQYQLSHDTYTGTVISKYSQNNNSYNVLRVDFDGIATLDVGVNRGDYLDKEVGSSVTFDYDFSLFGRGGIGVRDMSSLGDSSELSIVMASASIVFGLLILVILAVIGICMLWRRLGGLGKEDAIENEIEISQG